MSNWERITLMKLSDVLRAHVLESHVTDTQRRLLEPVLRQCNQASRTIDASHQDVQEVSGKLREICHAHASRPCDCTGSVGLSPGCYFRGEGRAN
jgi:hypothetical protein